MTATVDRTPPSVRWIRACVDEQRAAARLGASRLRPAWLKPSAPDARLRHRELVWVPYHLVRCELHGRRQECRELFSLVCALTGYSARIEKALLQAADGVPASTGVLESRLSREEAVAIATRALTRTLLSLRGRGLRVDSLAVVALVRYPYWIETFERRRGKLDLRSLDAVTGRRSGSAARQAILGALLREHRQRKERPSFASLV